MPKRKFKNILVTGGSGFIGSNFIRYLLEYQHYKYKIINLDKLTYAGNPDSLVNIEKKYKNYSFVRADICNFNYVKHIISENKIDAVVHFAAESHVDRSILVPKDFIYTNILGTYYLLEACRDVWCKKSKWPKGKIFYHISTDEVFGSLSDKGKFTETTPYLPTNPYSASKASADHLVRSYNKTFNMPIVMSNCSNNFGPYQFPEKLIPLMILNCIERKKLPVYGQGKNIRDWLYVEDHADAVWTILKNGDTGETYNIGGKYEIKNIELVTLICKKLAAVTKRNSEYYTKLITHVKDRPGHDYRYAMDTSKIEKNLGWKPKHTFENALEKTIKWYIENLNWVIKIKTGEYQNWINRNYTNR